MPDRPVLLYDADCGFCRWSAAKVLAWDRRGALRPVALQEPEALRLLPGMSEEERMDSAHVVTEQGEVLSGGAAAPFVLPLLPGGRPLGAIAGAVPGVAVRAYRWVSGNRDVFGKFVTQGAKARADRRIAART